MIGERRRSGYAYGLRSQSPRHGAVATQFFSKKRGSGGEPLATVCPIGPARNLNFIPLAQRQTCYLSINLRVLNIGSLFILKNTVPLAMQ